MLDTLVTAGALASLSDGAVGVAGSERPQAANGTVEANEITAIRMHFRMVLARAVRDPTELRGCILEVDIPRPIGSRARHPDPSGCSHPEPSGEGSRSR